MTSEGCGTCATFAVERFIPLIVQTIYLRMLHYQSTPSIILSFL